MQPSKMELAEGVGNIVSEFQKTGKLGNAKPKDIAAARRHALASLFGKKGGK